VHRNGRVPPSLTMCTPSSPARRLDGRVHLARRYPDALGDQFEVGMSPSMDVPMILPMCWGSAESVRADGQVGGPGDLLSSTITGPGRSRSRHVRTIFSDSFISSTRIT